MIAHNDSVNSSRLTGGFDRFTGSSQSSSAKVRIPISTRTDAGTGVRETRKDGVQAADNEARTEEARRRREELREDVVAVSEDGDTVQVSEEGSEELIESRDGSVFAKEESGAAALMSQTEWKNGDRQEIDAPEIEATGEAAGAVRQGAAGVSEAGNAGQDNERVRASENEPEAEEEASEPAERSPEAIRAEAEADRAEMEARTEAREIANEAIEAREEQTEATNEELASEEIRQEAAESKAQQPSTFAGISNQQLEQMYRDGQISQYTYDSEIAAREARDEELRAENEELSEDTARQQERQRSVTNAANEIRNATGSEASDTLTAKQRLEAIEKVEKLQEGNTKEARREEEQGRLWDYQLLT